MAYTSRLTGWSNWLSQEVMVLRRKIEVSQRKPHARYIIAGFVNWGEVRDDLFWMPFLSVKGSLYFSFLITILRELVCRYLFLFSVHLIKTFLNARHTTKCLFRDGERFRRK